MERPEQREIGMGRSRGKTKIETQPDAGSRNEMGEQQQPGTGTAARVLPHPAVKAPGA